MESFNITNNKKLISFSPVSWELKTFSIILETHTHIWIRRTNRICYWIFLNILLWKLIHLSCQMWANKILRVSSNKSRRIMKNLRKEIILSNLQTPQILKVKLKKPKRLKTKRKRRRRAQWKHWKNNWKSMKRWGFSMIHALALSW